MQKRSACGACFPPPIPHHYLHVVPQTLPKKENITGRKAAFISIYFPHLIWIKISYVSRRQLTFSFRLYLRDANPPGLPMPDTRHQHVHFTSQKERWQGDQEKGGDTLLMSWEKPDVCCYPRWMMIPPKRKPKPKPTLQLILRFYDTPATWCDGAWEHGLNHRQSPRLNSITCGQ